MSMADEIDNATENAELFLQQAIQANRIPESKLAPKGFCHYCETDFDKADPQFSKKLFCDSECAEAFAHEERLKALR